MAEKEEKKPKDFIISLDLDKKKVSELRYEKKDGKLSIYLTPEKECLTLRDFKFSDEETGLEKFSGVAIEKQLKLIGIMLDRLTYSEKRGIFVSYLKKEELGDK